MRARTVSCPSVSPEQGTIQSCVAGIFLPCNGSALKSCLPRTCFLLPPEQKCHSVSKPQADRFAHKVASLKQWFQLGRFAPVKQSCMVILNKPKECGDLDSLFLF